MVKLVGREVGSTGYGLMGLTWRPQLAPDEQIFPAMRKAIETGAVFWNGGEFYGDIMKGPNSMTLLSRYFTKYPEDREKVVLSIKGGVRPPMTHDGSPEGLKASIENCVRQLPPSIKKIDIWEAARVDHNYSIEDQMRATLPFVENGTIGAIGLSEVGADTIRRAAKVAPIASVEVEVSMWETTYLENGVMEACKELDIPVVAYSPLGRGFLTGQIKKPEDLPEGDFRASIPRLQGDNFYKNIELVDKLKAFASKKGCTPAQLALAWVRGLSGKDGKYPQIIPIPGATTEARVAENGTLETLTAAEEAEIDAVLKSITIEGLRYPEYAMGHLEA